MAAEQGKRPQLWQQYFLESQAHLHELEGLVDELRQNPEAVGPMEKIQGIFHQFAGSGSLYGAPKVSVLGGEGEYMLYSVLFAHKRLAPTEIDRFADLIRRLRSEFQALALAFGASEAPAQAQRSGAPRLLLAAADEAVRSTLGAALARRNLHVETAATLAESRSRMNATMPDLAIIGVSFPDGSGYDFVRELRHHEGSASLGILLLGAGESFMDKVEAIHCGADGYVSQPVDPATTLKKLKLLIAKRRERSARLLVIEDDPAQGRFLETCLSADGYSVRLVVDPTKFEEELHSFRPNMVIMDILLPGVSGLDLVRFMRQEEGFSALPVVFVTTEGQRQAQSLGAEAGGDDYLVKPVSPEDLLVTVRSRLARFKSLQDLMDRDELTSLLAHTPFLQQARLCLSRYSRRQTPYALAFLEIDRLTDHARRLGPRGRDLLVQALARLLRRRLRQTDLMGLYAENLIGVVLEQISEEDASRLLRRIQAEFQDVEVSGGGGRSVAASFSAGVAMTAPRFKTLKDWIDASLEALKSARQSGAGRTFLAGRQVPEG